MLNWLRSRIAGAPAAAAPADAASPVEAPPAPAPATPLALYRAGQAEPAGAAAAAMAAADPAAVEALVVRALIAVDARNVQEALRYLDRARSLQPACADVHVAIGRASLAAGRRPAAVQALRHALELDQGNADAAFQLGLLALGSNEAEALAWLERAVANDPQLAQAQFHLGNLQRGRGQLDAAERSYRRAVQARPDYADAHCNLGSLLKDSGRTREAAQHLERAMQLAPALAAASFNLAMIRLDEQDWSEAAVLLRTSLAADPKQADAQYWLANACMGAGDHAAARQACQAAIRLDPGYVQARWGAVMAQLPAVALTDAQQTAAVEAFARELGKLKVWLRVQRPANAHLAVGAQQPYYLAYIPQDHRVALAEYGGLCSSLMAGWARKVGVPAPAASGGSKCRVGIVSAHIHGHSVWHAIVRGWIRHLDPARFEIHVFHTGRARDGETEWAARRVSRLHQQPQDWPAWARTISDSRIDVLVYPEIGMDSTTVRLAALRLARVQLASWGHPITTGLPTIDAFVSAEAFEPAGAAAHYTEKLLTLPRLGCCYERYGTASGPADLTSWGVAANDRILLCAGTPFKYAPKYDVLLVELARRCRPCKLVFFQPHARALSELLLQRLRGAFEAAGMRVDDHVRFVPWQTQAAFFGLLDRADAYLDTAGFSGFNTAMQAIERGTPVVAWEGEFMRGRFASAILRQAGLDEWVADSADGYVERVERLCADRALRDTVRGRIAAQRATLFDDRAVVAAFGVRLLELHGAR